MAYFMSNKELSDLILKQGQIVLPGSGLHSTLCVFYMDEENEPALIEDLSHIDFKAFRTRIVGFDDFDKGSLVLRLSRSDNLVKLHRDIVSIVLHYVSSESQFGKTVGQYYLENYNPHLTISESSSDFNRENNALMGKEIFVSEYVLAKKEGNNWEKVSFFSSME